MYTIEQQADIVAAERQHHIFRHVPEGREPAEVHRGLVQRAYQPNQELEVTARHIASQVQQLIQAGRKPIRALCPTAEIKARVEQLLSEDELKKISLEIGI